MIKEDIREIVNIEMRNFLEKKGKMIFFKNGIKLSDGSEIISLTCNSVNCLLTTRNIYVKTEILNNVNMGIIEEVIDLMNDKNNLISSYAWVAFENNGDWFETPTIGYYDEDSALKAMINNAMAYIKDITYNSINKNTINEFNIKLEINNKTLKADWITYKLVMVNP